MATCAGVLAGVDNLEQHKKDRRSHQKHVHFNAYGKRVRQNGCSPVRLYEESCGTVCNKHRYSVVEEAKYVYGVDALRQAQQEECPRRESLETKRSSSELLGLNGAQSCLISARNIVHAAMLQDVAGDDTFVCKYIQKTKPKLARYSPAKSSCAGKIFPADIL
jgi:hypothetical protein